MRGYCLEHCWSTVRALWSTVLPCSPRLRCVGALVLQVMALYCLLSPTPCPLWLLLLTLQLFFYTFCWPKFVPLVFFKILWWPWRNPVSGTVDGQNPAPPHHFTLEGSHSNPRAPSFNVGATPLRRWCRILDLQLVFVFSLWWPQC